MNKALVSFSLLTMLSLVAIAGVQPVHADTNDGVLYSSGVYLISPLNRTYTTNTLTLHLNFQEGIKSTLNYTLDDKYSGDIPLTVLNASDVHIIWTEMTGTVPLPPLSDGSHCLKITVDAELNGYYGANPPGAPFKATNAEGTNWAAVWVHTVYFTVDTGAATPTPTPTAVTSPSPTPTPTEITAANPPQTAVSPTPEPQPSTPIAVVIILVAAVVYVAVIVVLATRKGKP